MEKEYKTFEEKHFPIWGEYVTGLYSSIAGFFRLPTTIRKFKNKQLLYQKLNDGDLESQDALPTGVFTGLFIDGILTSNFNSIEELLYVWLATNTASGIYELVTSIKSKKQSKLENQVKGDNK